MEKGKHTESKKSIERKSYTESKKYTEKAVVHTGVSSKVITKTKSQLIEAVNAYLTEAHPAEYYGWIDTMLELIYFAYTETNPVENERVRENYSGLHERFMALTESEEKADSLMNFVSAACGEYERAAYMEGLRVGARLVMELTSDTVAE